jgi:hypothetical protein
VAPGFEPQLTESLYMGCVSYSLKYFPDGKIEKSGMRAAEFAARQELAGIVRAYRAAGWDEAVASSGTARSIENILRENGFAEGRPDARRPREAEVLAAEERKGGSGPRRRAAPQPRPGAAGRRRDPQRRVRRARSSRR